MKNKKMTIIILFMIIIVIAIIIICISLLYFTKNNNNTIVDKELILLDDVEQVSNKTTFYRINNCINKYINSIKLQNELSYKAINKNINSIEEYNDIEYFVSEDMYSIGKAGNITAFVKGYLRNKVSENEKYYIVSLDYNNNTFNISDSNIEEYINATNNQIQENYKQIAEIIPNQYNTIEDRNITNFSILKIYFDDFKFKAINKPEQAFELIDLEYKKMKFNNDINQFKQYVKDNEEKLKDANIVKHGVIQVEGKNEYTVIDNFENYYKFVECEINEYTIILDNYTLQSDELKQEYLKLSAQEKVLSNIDKIMKLINAKDYQTVYNYLNENFKNTNFPSIEKFTAYMQNTFFENNIVGNISMKEEGGNYILEVPYKESLSRAAEERSKSFVMKLGNGMNFEISFNV